VIALLLDDRETDVGMVFLGRLRDRATRGGGKALCVNLAREPDR
jgi:hypothetical protein